MKHSFNAITALGLTLTLGITAAPVANSETVVIPLGQQGDHWNVGRPQTGASKTQVAGQYGDPLERSGPVGSPGIYTWTYEKFKVYFEGDHVIHSVVIAQ